MFKLFSIAANTFTETLRQPVYSVILVCAILLFFLSPSLTTYTLDEDQDLNLLREIALSTLFLTGLFISIFAATGAITEEIETGTITTVLSKPVSRPVFVAGKFFGIMAAVILAHYIASIAVLMTVRHGILFNATDTHDWTVIVSAAVAILATLVISAFLNYIYDWNFPSTAVGLLALGATGCIIFLSFIDRDWKFNPAGNRFTSFEINASILLLLAVMILVALAVLFSTRLNIVLTLTCCVGAFLLGLISDYVFGRFAGENLLARVAYALVPNFQVFWVTDAQYAEGSIPLGYILRVGAYALLYTTGILGLAVALFQKRQVG